MVQFFTHFLHNVISEFEKAKTKTKANLVITVCCTRARARVCALGAHIFKLATKLESFNSNGMFFFFSLKKTKIFQFDAKQNT